MARILLSTVVMCYSSAFSSGISTWRNPGWTEPSSTAEDYSFQMSMRRMARPSKIKK
jgi:hypothetical protein